MNISEFVDLASYTTFGTTGIARYLASVTNTEDLDTLRAHELWGVTPYFILGGGSNLLVVNDYQGLVIHNDVLGFEILEEDESSVRVRVGGGESWHRFVMVTVDQGWWGIENLALIPGTVGAAPVQNIGAYGVEAGESIEQVEVVDLTTGQRKVFVHDECNFSYRTSIFKQELNRYFITHVIFRFSKLPNPHLSYEPLAKVFEHRPIESLTPRQVTQEVIAIRDAKLPRVGELGTAGSFFENPVVTKDMAERLQKIYPEMKQFPLSSDYVKLSAAWLIDSLGFKGYREDKVGVYEQHALVLVSYGGATGKEVQRLAQKIIDQVYDTYGVLLVPEVRIIG